MIDLIIVAVISWLGGYGVSGIPLPPGTSAFSRKVIGKKNIIQIIIILHK